MFPSSNKGFATNKGSWAPDRGNPNRSNSDSGSDPKDKVR